MILGKVSAKERYPQLLLRRVPKGGDCLLSVADSDEGDQDSELIVISEATVVVLFPEIRRLAKRWSPPPD